MAEFRGVKAVFKPCPHDELGDAYAEVAAYKASCVLGFPNVPPTILAEVNGKKGSLQLFIDTPIDALAPNVFKNTLKEIDPEELNNLLIFYFVFGQWDTGAHNILIVTDESGKKHLIPIDNSGIQNSQHVKYGELPFVRVCYSEGLETDDWDKPFPFESALIVQDSSPDNLKKVFGDKLPSTFFEKLNFYGEPLRYVVYKNSLWIQYHASDKEFLKSHVTSGSKKTKEALQKLDLPTLKAIFSHAKGADFLTEGYFSSILGRRDQVIQNVNWE